MDKKDLTEQEIRTRYITPAIRQARGQPHQIRAVFTYVDVSSVDNEPGVITRDLAVMSPEETTPRARKRVRQGAVIHSTVRPYLLNLAIVDRDTEPVPIVSAAFDVVHPLPGIDARYLILLPAQQALRGFREVSGGGDGVTSDQQRQVTA